MIRRKKAEGKRLGILDARGRCKEMRHGGRHYHTWLTVGRRDPRLKIRS